MEVSLYQFIVVNERFYVLLIKIFIFFVNEGFLYFVEGFLYFVNEGFLYFVDEGFLYFEDMNDIDRSHFLFPIKEPFRAEQLAKNLIQ
jgi:hypothetical protein